MGSSESKSESKSNCDSKIDAKVNLDVDAAKVAKTCSTVLQKLAKGVVRKRVGEIIKFWLNY